MYVTVVVYGYSQMLDYVHCRATHQHVMSQSLTRYQSQCFAPAHVKFQISDVPTVSDIEFEDPFSGEEVEFMPKCSSENLYSNSLLSVVQAVTLLMSWFSAFPGMSKESFSRLLVILHAFLLPPGNILPTTYSSALKLLKPYLSPVKEYHCCVNDCVLFRNSSRGAYEKHVKCPVCNEPRFLSHGKIPRKRFKYMSVVTRLHRYFSNSHTSELLQNHWQCSGEHSNEIVTSIHQSPAWHEWYSPSGVFKGEHRSISFALCTDGLNPFSHEKTQYSMWPIFLVPLNMPHSIRMKTGSMFLTGIIPGPKEPKNMDPYIDVLVDDILDIEGVEMYDAFKKEWFRSKGNILLHVLDYPGQNKVFKCQGNDHDFT